MENLIKMPLLVEQVNRGLLSESLRQEPGDPAYNKDLSLDNLIDTLQNPDIPYCC